MKKALLTKLMLLLCALIAGSSSVWATAPDYTYTLASGDFTTDSHSKTSGSLTWTHSHSSGTESYGMDNTYGFKFGSSNNSYPTAFKLTSSSVSNKIKKVVVTASVNSNKSCKLNVKVGSTTYGSQATINTKNNDTFEFEIADASTVNGAVELSFSSNTGPLYLNKIEIYYYSDGGSSTPSITVSDVNIAYDATNGSIGYSIDNGNGNVTASVTSGDWLTLGTITASAVPFTCSANTGSTTARTATVTLSYTGASNKIVTITQAADPNAFHNISDITAASTAYKVKGTVVATSTKGLVIGDGTGYVYYYKNGAVSQSVGDIITISGSTGTYGHILQFTNSATIATAATSNYNNTPMVTVVDATAIATYNSDYQLSDYVQFQGALVKDNNNNYNITVGTATARISYPTDAQKTALDALLNKTVRVKGYFTGFTSSNFTVMLESAEEVAVPTITATPTSRAGFFYMPGNGPSATKTISVAGSNLTADITLITSANYEMCLTENGDYTSSLTLTQNAGTVTATTVYVRMKAGLTSNNYAGTITLTSTGATDVTVNLTGNVPALASLPFSWTGTSSAGKTELAAVTGVEVNLGSDFAESNAPYRLKFDGTTKYVVIYTNEKPEAVSFTAKLYNATTTNTGSKIKVQSSSDGITYTDVEEFTIKGVANATFEFTTSKAFTATHRAVKLIMSNQDQNVGVGYIGISGTSFPIIPAKDYTTLTSTFPLDFTGLANLEAYIVTDNDASDGYVTLTQVNKVPANTGLVLKAASTGSPIDVPVFDGTGADDVTGNLMAGSATETTAIAANAGYILKDGAFHPANAGTLPAGKAYLHISASAPVLLLNFDGDVTGVNEVRGKMEDVRGEMYDLQGRKVAQPTKGLYIVNGKKYVVK